MSLLVAGALHLDVVVRAPHLPQLDETVSGESVRYVLGGKGGNQALAAAKMGAPTHFAGRTGNDSFGAMMRQRLEEAGIDTARVQSDPGASGMSVAIVESSGEYGAVIVSAANLNIDADAITLPEDLRILSLQNEIPEPVNVTLARRAKKVGAQIWLNAAPARPIAPDLMALVDLMVVNRVEVAFYRGSGPLPALLETQGGQGLTFNNRHWPAFDVPVRSVHGAGDTFIGALAAGVWEGASIEEALPFAQAAAALHVSADPAAPNSRYRAAVEAFLAAQPSR